MANAPVKASLSVAVDPHPKLTRIAPWARLELNAHRRKDVRRRHLARRAGRPRADGDAGKIERDHQGRRRDSRDSEADCIGQPGQLLAENDDIGRKLAQAIRKPPAQRKKPAPFRLAGRHGGAHRRAESGDRRHVLRACACAPLLPAAADQRVAEAQAGVRRDDGADPLRAAHLMGRKGERIGVERLKGAVGPTRGLNGVRHDETARSVNHRRRRSDRLDHAGFVVGALKRQKRSSGAPAGVIEPAEIDPAVRKERRDLDGRRRKPVSIQDARMLACPYDQPLERRSVRPDAEARIEERVDRFGRPGDERHASGRRARKPRDLGAGVLDDPSRLASLRVDGRGVPDRAEACDNRLQRFRPDRRGRIVIEVGSGRRPRHGHQAPPSN